MITVKGPAEGTATYSLDPYPQWHGDEQMSTVGELIRQQVDEKLMAGGLVVDAPDRSIRQHEAFIQELQDRGFKIVEAVIPGLDEPYDPEFVN